LTLKINGHDNAIIGRACIWRNDTMVDVLVYDADVIRANLVREGMDFEDAREHIHFNIEGAYAGLFTPVLVWPQDLWDDTWEEE
jgi:aspartate oxidase